MAIQMAGNCMFSETHGWRGMRVFGLFDRGSKFLAPVSQAGHETRGVTSHHEGRELALRMNFLDPRVNRALIGASVVQGHDFAAAAYGLRLTLDTGDHLDFPIPRAVGAGKRYAILGAILPVAGIGWEFRTLPQPALFATKQELARTYLVPPWWVSLGG